MAKPGPERVWLTWFVSTPILSVAGVSTLFYFALPLEVAWWKIALGVAGAWWLISGAVRDGLDHPVLWKWQLPGAIRDGIREAAKDGWPPSP